MVAGKFMENILQENVSVRHGGEQSGKSLGQQLKEVSEKTRRVILF
jgi:hypothetical protein